MVDKPLLGRNLALLRTSPPGSGISVLHRAALDLGARVAVLRFADAGVPPQGELRALSRMLGRMYDAIDCGTMASTVVRQIERDAGVPVYDGLDRDDHPVRVLADLMTLYEHGLPPASGMSLLLLGDPHSMRSDALLSAARAVGFQAALDEVERSENHRFVLQTVLLNTIATA